MILDTFYLLFKSDTKDAVKDVTELDKKVNTLKESGKKRSEQESKNTKESIKQQKEVNDTLRETENRYEGLTTKVAQYAASYFSLRSAASSFLNTVQNNAALQNQADLLGQNSAGLKAYGAAVRAAGGSAEELYSYQQSLFERFSSLGLKTPDISEVFKKVREQLKLAGNNPAQREYIFQQFGFTPGMKTFASLDDKEFNAREAQGFALTASIAEAGKVSKEFVAIWAGYSQTLDDINTKLSSKLLPLVKSSVNTYVNAGRKWANIFEPVAGGDERTSSPGASRGGKKTSLTYDRKKDLAFWMSQGYSKEQAAAWVAAEEAESGGNARAIGDGGRARGLFQWHPDRRAKILKGTGININSASHDEQLKAAAWEAVQRGDAALIKGQSTAQGAASIHTRFFERPADIAGESMRRGRLAMEIASGTQLTETPSGGKSISVKTGDIHVHSAATDATGIAKDTAAEIERHINMAISNLDDGVAR